MGPQLRLIPQLLSNLSEIKSQSHSTHAYGAERATLPSALWGREGSALWGREGHSSQCPVGQGGSLSVGQGGSLSPVPCGVGGSLSLVAPVPYGALWGREGHSPQSP